MTTEHKPDDQDSEPAVRNEVVAPLTGHVVQAGTIQGGVNVHDGPRRVVPRQLPAAPGTFTGRRNELAQLTTALDSTAPGGAVVISAINGVGGIGKTALALYWAHQHIDRFPDGQLFVNLRGFDPTGQPMRSATALRGFLDAFNVDPERIPVDLEAQAGLYRSLVVGKRMLILLDNASNADQVSTLLPGSATCTVLVTSRYHLTGLITTHQAQPLPLNVLTEAEARQLLADRLGQQRVSAEPEAVDELVTCCAGLPLALGIVAARAAMHPDLSLAVWASELRNTATRLDALDGGDPWSNLSVVFSWSYRALSPAAAELFRLLGLAPGPDIGQPAVDRLTGHSSQRVSVLLRELDRACLVQQHAPGRWRMHDLVKLYARDHVDQHEDTRDVALRRLVEFYLHTAHAADGLLDPHRPPIKIDPPGARPHPLSNKAAAWAWFEADHSCLLASQRVAAERGWHNTVWQLAWVLDTFHTRRGHLHDNLAAWQAGLAAAQYAGETTALIVAYRFLGYACALVDKSADALEHLGHALVLAKDTEDFPGLAHTHYALAEAWGQREDDRQALEHAASALGLYQALDEPVWKADMLNSVGWYSARLGRYEQARKNCDEALDLCRRHGHLVGEAATLNSLGYLAHCTGQYDQALNCYQQALTRYRDFSYTYAEAATMDLLAQTHVDLGHHDQARQAWQRALKLYQMQHRVKDAQRVQRQLDELNR